MQRSVVIGRVVSIEPVLDHLIDEPTVDPFVEMRRFDPKQKKSKKDRKPEDQPWRPTRFGDGGFPSFNLTVIECACTSSVSLGKVHDFGFWGFSDNGRKGHQRSQENISRTFVLQSAIDDSFNSIL